MKKITLFTLLVCFCYAGFSQTDCKPYIPTEEGAKWEITTYTAKGKAEGTIVYELLEKTESGNDLTFTIKNTTFDKKGEEIYTNTFEAKCVDGKFEFDMAYKMDASSMAAYQDMDMTVDASAFTIPSLDEAPGTSLPDGNLKVGVDAGPMKLNMTVFVTDRKIEARESLTTPAGTFDCVVLSQAISTKMIVKVEAASKEWYAEGIGMVRSESYNKKGKMTGYSVLTKLEQ